MNSLLSSTDLVIFFGSLIAVMGMGLWVEQLQRRGAMGEDIMIRNAPWDCPGMALQFSASEGNVAGFEFNEVGGCN